MVQLATSLMIRKEHDIQMRLLGRPSEFIKLFIPNNYVTRMIGVGGCIMRDIALKSGGAQITIQSNKESKKHLQDCPVLISGTLANKQDAACLVIYQLQALKLINPHFKNDSRPVIPYEHKNSESDVLLAKRESHNLKPKSEVDDDFWRGLEVVNPNQFDSVLKATPPHLPLDNQFSLESDLWQNPPLKHDFVWSLR